MRKVITIADEVYARLRTNGKRVQGSVGVISDDELSFNAYNIKAPRAKCVYKLAHGEASVRGTCAHLHLRIDMVHERVDVCDAIARESTEAQMFFDEITSRDGRAE